MVEPSIPNGSNDRPNGIPRIHIEWPPLATREGGAHRAPEPLLRYGWRSVIGAIGRLFVSLGILLFGFVAFQLWGTGLQTAKHQERLSKEFQAAQLASPLPLATTTPPAPTTALPSNGASSTSALPTTTTTTPPRPLPIPDDGQPMALLEIPKIGLSNTVVSGVTTDDLKKGVGHFRTSPLPGQRGNVALAGHRTTYAAPFSRLDELKTGDPIILTTVTKEKYVYTVTSQEVVDPSNVGVLAATPTPTLTLTTCTPKRTSTNRLIIHAELSLRDSTGPVREPTPPAEGSVVTIPAETTVAATPSTTLVPGATTAVSSSPTTLVAPTSTTIFDALTADDNGELTEAFTRGWFSDKNAPPQIAVWGSACGLIGLGSWLLSRRLRRNMVGFLVGIFPFMFAIFFFYENVNRVLPPGL